MGYMKPKLSLQSTKRTTSPWHRGKVMMLYVEPWIRPASAQPAKCPGRTRVPNQGQCDVSWQVGEKDSVNAAMLKQVNGERVRIPLNSGISIALSVYHDIFALLDVLLQRGHVQVTPFSTWCLPLQRHMSEM